MSASAAARGVFVIAAAACRQAQGREKLEGSKGAQERGDEEKREWKTGASERGKQKRRERGEEEEEEKKES